MCIEEEFAIQMPDEDAEKLETIADCIKYFSHHPQAM